MRILVLEPNPAMRAALVEALVAEGFAAEPCESLSQLVAHAAVDRRDVALAAWQSMDGLLAEEHRHELAELTRRLRLVLMVPRRWLRLLAPSDLGAESLVPRPFDRGELLASLRRVLEHEPAAPV